MLKSVFHLPAHPLFVHAPLVLVPLTTLLAILFIVRPGFRDKFSVHFVVATFVGFVATVIATESGEQFDEMLKRLAPIKEHAELAETTRLLCFVLFLLAIGQLGVLRWARSKPGAAKTITVGFSVIVGVVSILASVWMIRTGHEGARVVWADTIKK